MTGVEKLATGLVAAASLSQSMLIDETGDAASAGDADPMTRASAAIPAATAAAV